MNEPTKWDDLYYETVPPKWKRAVAFANDYDRYYIVYHRQHGHFKVHGTPDELAAVDKLIEMANR